MNALSFRSAGVELGGRPVWTDVNLEIPEHEFVAILGPNGVGQVDARSTRSSGSCPLTAGEIRSSDGRPASPTTTSATSRSGAASTRRCASAASTSCASGSTAIATASRSPARGAGANGHGSTS